ncbi:hypothetical protein QQW99_19435 [Bacillus amyloliquefaciens]|uniref:hypothetical protein n=1 Tax=Bacillus amyloliquefaciens TaxID=1390 RepID=UPI00255C0C73|nr:hypothetical protein [Bacillus amyloliquefaciens]WIX29265.1 hypothetical protein QQW99_19435 [Bacillus amyloliquefaciens]
MGGLITGIMLARPLANGLAALSGWRTVFGVSAVAMALLALLIARTVPAWRPRPTLGYGALLRSGLSLLVRTPAIRRRTAYQAIMFVVFNLFRAADRADRQADPSRGRAAARAAARHLSSDRHADGGARHDADRHGRGGRADAGERVDLGRRRPQHAGADAL